MWGGAVSCATSQHQALRSVEVGMDKSEVLEHLGNPIRKTRQHGQDRWTYEIESASAGAETIYIFFDSGKVTYSGPAPDSPSEKVEPAVKEKSSDFKPVGNDS